MRSAIPIASSRSTGRDSAARIDGTRAAAMESMRVRLVVAASRQAVVISASAAMQTLTPRQPIQEPTQAASGTPTRSVSDWPLITQPSARPCWVGRTRDETSVNTVPLNRPQNPPAIVPQTATARKLPPVATPTVATASPSGPPIRNGRVPQRSEPAPAKIEVMPQATEVMATRLAISGTLTERSRAMSIRNGARVVPLAATVNIASEAASSRGQGRRSRVTNRVAVWVGRSVAVMRWWSATAACWRFPWLFRP